MERESSAPGLGRRHAPGGARQAGAADQFGQRGFVVLLDDLLQRQQTEIAKALPTHIKPEAFVRHALTTIKKSPGLAQCDPMTIIGGLIISQLLTLYTTPVVYLFFDRFSTRLAAARRGGDRGPGTAD